MNRERFNLECRIIASDTQALYDIANARGIQMPHPALSIFSSTLCEIENPNANRVRLGKKATLEALDTIIGTQINFNHVRKGAICGYVIDATLNNNDEMDITCIFFKEIYETEWEYAQTLFSKDKLTMSFEISADVESQDKLKDGTRRMNDYYFTGAGLLMGKKPACKSAKVFEMAEELDAKREELIFAEIKNKNETILKSLIRVVEYAKENYKGESKMEKVTKDIITDDKEKLASIEPEVTPVEAETPVEQPEVVVEPEVAPVEAEVEPEVAPVETEVEPEVAPVEAEVEPEVAPVETEVEPEVAPVEAEVEPEVAPVETEVEPEVAPVEAEVEPEVAPVETEVEPEVAPVETEVEPEEAEAPIEQVNPTVTNKVTIVQEEQVSDKDIHQVSTNVQQVSKTVYPEGDSTTHILSQDTVETWIWEQVQAMKTDYESAIAELNTMLSEKDKEIENVKLTAEKVVTNRIELSANEFAKELTDEDLANDEKVAEVKAMKERADKLATIKEELKENKFAKDFSEEDYLNAEKVENAKLKKENDELKKKKDEKAEVSQEVVQATEENLETGHTEVVREFKTTNPVSKVILSSRKK